MFQRTGSAALRPSLDNIKALCARLGHPENKFQSVHIAGTNGKGSVSHFLASCFQENGLKTGLYTSPHLKDFRERIKIDGEMISEEEVVRFTEHMQEFSGELSPSFFEMTMAMAFDHFSRHEVDIAVIETGLGGRLDATNVITPLVSVITNIGLDHTSFLGDTLPLIAGEKAGIIKEKVPVVIGEYQGETISVFLKKAREMNSSLHLAETNYECHLDSRVPLPGSTSMIIMDRNRNQKIKGVSGLNGSWQNKNIATTWQTLELLEKKLSLNEKDNLLGIENVIKNTGLRGRWEKLQDKPTVICDTGHNEPGIREAMKQLSYLKKERLHIVFGVVADKDPTEVLRLLPQSAAYYFCAADIPRAMDPEELAQKASAVGISGVSYTSVREAINAAKAMADKEKDIIFIGGSIFVVAEAL